MAAPPGFVTGPSAGIGPSEFGNIDLSKINLAWFSTDGGRYEPLPLLKPPRPVIVRSDILKDVAEYIRGVRAKWPHFCNSFMYSPWDIGYFFTENDFNEMGGSFCVRVIETMRAENQKRMVEYCRQWSDAHQPYFPHWEHIFQRPVEDIFHDADLKTHGRRFLDLSLDYMIGAYKRNIAQWMSENNGLQLGKSLD